MWKAAPEPYLDEERVHGVVVPDDGPPHEDRDVPEAGEQRHHPHGRPQDGALQQVVAAGETVPFRLTVADVGRVGAHVERVEVTAKDNKMR